MNWATTRRKSRRVSRQTTPGHRPICDQVAAVNRAADAADTVLRLAMDAKATVKVGPLARGGKSRGLTVAADHAFHPDATVPPHEGLFLPALDELFLYGITSKVTRDYLVDCLMRWWEGVHERFAPITTLVINLDNGPENHSRRTQVMRRMVGFAAAAGLTVRLASYPPYPSKYNPMGVVYSWGRAGIAADIRYTFGTP